MMRRPAGSDDSRAAAPEKLLVVEDDGYLREEIMRVLERRTNYVADSVASGEEALEKASGTRYDLLITDVRMPGIDGIELLERLKQHRPDLVGIVITAFADEEATIRALKIGASDYIRKPFSIHDLIGAIDRQITVLRLRREAERSRRLLENIIRSVDAGVIAIDGEGRVVEINKAAFETLQAGHEDVIGGEIAVLLQFEGGEAISSLLRDLETKSVKTLERELTLHQAGLPVTYRVAATAIHDDTGRRLGTVLLFNDVSRVVQTEKLRAWKDLARTVAHEIKNPLTPIKLSAQQLLSAMEAGPDAVKAQLETAVSNIIKNADRLDTLAREFSRFGRLPKPQMKPLEINEVLDEALSAFAGAAENNGIRIVRHLTGGLPPVSGDRESLLRMTGNLVSNAIDAMPGGGTLTVSSSAVESGNIRIAFADTGTGIDEEVRNRLFLPYVTSKPGGTGLGLVVVKEVVSAHDGSIGVESERGKGTTITISLPALR
jgi:two-component system nitrogen regulation sensor histidine kinase NtrY